MLVYYKVKFLEVYISKNFYTVIIFYHEKHNKNMNRKTFR